MTVDEGKRLSAKQLLRALELADQSDSVELKLTVPERAARSVVRALGIDPLDAQIRQVFFFDTPDLTLNEAGLVLRARRVQGRNSDSVVKLRPVDPTELSADLRMSPGFGVELDAMPGGFVCSASMKAKLPPRAVLPAVSGEAQLRKLFTKEQRAFYKQYSPDGLAIDELDVLGPIFVLKVKVQPKALGRELVGELWLYPDGSRVVELSTKCEPAEAVRVATETRVFLDGLGLDLSGDQQTKTKTALTFFSAELQPQPG